MLRRGKIHAVDRKRTYVGQGSMGRRNVRQTYAAKIHRARNHCGKKNRMSLMKTASALEVRMKTKIE